MTESLLLLKGRTISQSSDGIFRSIHFSRSTEDDPFVQSITNDDVLAKNKRRKHYFFRKQFTGHLRPSAGSSELQSIQSIFQQRSDRLSKLQRATHFQFSNSGQTGLASFNELLKCCREFSYQYNELQYFRVCVRSEVYTVLLARKGSHFSHDTSRTYSQSLQILCYSSDQVVISDITLPNSNTRHEKLLREFSGTTLPARKTLAAGASSVRGLGDANLFRKSHIRMHESTNNSRGKRQSYVRYYCTALQRYKDYTTPLKSA